MVESEGLLVEARSGWSPDACVTTRYLDAWSSIWGSCRPRSGRYDVLDEDVAPLSPLKRENPNVPTPYGIRASDP